VTKLKDPQRHLTKLCWSCFKCRSTCTKIFDAQVSKII